MISLSTLSVKCRGTRRNFFWEGFTSGLIVDFSMWFLDLPILEHRRGSFCFPTLERYVVGLERILVSPGFLCPFISKILLFLASQLPDVRLSRIEDIMGTSPLLKHLYLGEFLLSCCQLEPLEFWRVNSAWSLFMKLFGLPVSAIQLLFDVVRGNSIPYFVFYLRVILRWVSLSKFLVLKLMNFPIVKYLLDIVRAIGVELFMAGLRLGIVFCS